MWGCVPPPCCISQPAPCARAASWSLAAITRRTTTASKWFWRDARSMGLKFRRCARRLKRKTGFCNRGQHSPCGRAGRLHRAHRGDVKLARPVKIVVDCGNGVAGATAPAIFRALGCEVLELFSEVDGNFPTTTPTLASQRICAMLSKPCKRPMQSWAWRLMATVTAWAL